MTVSATAVSPTLEKYQQHLRVTADWLVRSIDKGNGGSSAHFSPIGWSKPYPETTGYIIPTLLNLATELDEKRFEEAAHRAGEWLLGIQMENGAWQGGLYPTNDAKPSVFNTGQILKGMCALARSTGDSRWSEAADRGAQWLASGVKSENLWEHKDYQSEVTPTYYTHVAWPMLEAWSLTGDEQCRNAAVQVLDVMASRVQEDGGFEGWEFQPGKPAFTHTIAYTIRGFQESARLLDEWSRYGELVNPALDKIVRHAELGGGQLPGAYYSGWKKVDSYCCLTGNVQLAISLLILEARENDLRLVNAAAKLVDYVVSCQNLNHPIAGVRGGVAGSKPIWKDYMKYRYPNWAAKYHCDALMRISNRLEREYEETE